MALEQIYFIAEIIAAVTVVASLIYVGIQLRQNTLTIRVAAGQTHVDAYATLLGQLTDSSDLLEAWVKSARDFDVLNPVEQTHVRAFVGVMFRNFEGAYIQHEQGVLDDRFWTGMLRSMSDQYAHAAIRDFWSVRRHWYSEEFAEWFDREVVSKHTE